MFQNTLLFVILLSSFLLCRKVEISRYQHTHPKLSFLNDDETRRNDAPLLSCETYRAAADFILDETSWELDTDSLFDGCVIFIDLRFLTEFYEKILPHISNKIVLVTHGHVPYNSHGYSMNWMQYTGSENYMIPKYAAHPNILAFFCKNTSYRHPKCHAIPIGKSHFVPSQSIPLLNNIAKLTVEDYFKEKPNLVYLNLARITNPRVRGPI